MERTTIPKKELALEVIHHPLVATRELNNRSFYHFLKCFWHIVSPHDFQENWHIKLLCEELEKLAYRVAAGLPREYDLIVNVPPGTTKPVWEEEEVLMANGSYKQLKNIEIGDLVINKNGQATAVNNIHIQGNQECVKIDTNGGRSIYVALDHPVLTTNGWVNGGDLKEGHYLALMHSPNILGSVNRTLDEFKLAGYFIGDGSTSSKNCSVCGVEMEYIDDFIACAERVGFGYYKFVDKNGVTIVNLKNKNKADGSNKGKYKGMGRGFRIITGPRQWLRDIGVAGKTSRTKKIPDFVWNGSNKQVAAFLATYFQCDGTIYYNHDNRRNIKVSASTISKELAFGLQRLFLRLGVAMNVRQKIAKHGFVYNRGLENYIYYAVETSDQDSACRFLEKIPITGYKLKKLADFYPQRRTFRQEYWPDEVKLITHIGKLPCRCLSVSKGSSFIVDGVVVHNSITCSHLFPAWCWTKWYWMRFITASYSEKLALESAEYCREVLRSQKWQELYPEIQVKDDKDVKGNFKVVKKVQEGPDRRSIHTYIGGGRLSTSVGGTIVGFHGDILIVDDPLKPDEAASEVELGNANRWVEQSLSTRKTNKAVTPTVLIMQRLHQDDPSGHFLAKNKENVRHICLPGEIRNYKDKVNPPELIKFYKDQLLDPNRLSWKVLADMEADLGQYGYAGQVGQDPTPPGGGMFKVGHIQLLNTMPDAHLIEQTVRYWDKAGTTTGKSAFTAGVRMSKLKKCKQFPDGGFIVENVKRGRWSTDERERIIKTTNFADGFGLDFWIEQEPGSGGLESAQGTLRNNLGLNIKAHKPSGTEGDKPRRADQFSVAVNSDLVYMINGDWNHDYIEELRFFPFSTYKDQVDSSSGAFNKLVSKRIARAV